MWITSVLPSQRCQLGKVNYTQELLTPTKQIYPELDTFKRCVNASKHSCSLLHLGRQRNPSERYKFDKSTKILKSYCPPGSTFIWCPPCMCLCFIARMHDECGAANMLRFEPVAPRLHPSSLAVCKRPRGHCTVVQSSYIDSSGRTVATVSRAPEHSG